jgi:hypothetical protein
MAIMTLDDPVAIPVKGPLRHPRQASVLCLKLAGTRCRKWGVKLRPAWIAKRRANNNISEVVNGTRFVPASIWVTSTVGEQRLRNRKHTI